MELFQTDLHYIILNGEHSLWCNRSNGKLEPKSGTELMDAWDPTCLGLVYGVIGKVKLHPESEWRLLLIKQRSLACRLAGKNDVYKINKIAILPLTGSEQPTDLDLETCKKHSYDGSSKSSQSNDSSQMSLRGTWNSIKTVAENVKSKKRETKDKEKFEKRILEELLKMYNDSDFFYYSDNFDLTTSLQRQNAADYDKDLPLWKRADERFFWNKHMLLELMEAETPLADPWILPVIQGYVQMEKCVMDFEEDKRANPDYSSSVDFPSQKLEPLEYFISIISRRSRHRAGTRSRKRGINATGACANYVETEQIIEFSPHLVSFVQIRGSIPVFWSQSGFKYRPPPRLDKDEDASHEAFTKHFDEQLNLYKKVTVISLAELAGKEHVIGDAYLAHVLKFNSPDVTYVTFDFHEYCRGMRFENVSILTDGIKDIIKDLRYCWLDNRGVICEQLGVFRVNCVDCLDRTNVVQTAVARIVMETQFRKLGLLPPEENLPTRCKQTYQQIWANNGDAISHQYAGTAALKGDFTRTGERKISGMMKDGMNSASRYYLRFRDAHRQAAIDLTLGQPVSEALLAPSVEVDEVDGNELVEKEENVKMMIEDSKRMLIVEPEHCLGGWALINADSVEGDSDRQDMDIILLLSQRSVYIAWYDDEQEQVTQYQRIYLEDIDRIEIGMEPAVFKSRFLCMRLVYHYMADEGLFHMFRTPMSRLFNNKVVTIQSHEEAKESLKIIAEAFRSAQEILRLELEIVEKSKLDRRKRPPHPEVTDIHQQQQQNSLSCIKLPRDVSSDMRASTSSHNDELNITVMERSSEKEQKSATLPRSKSPLGFLNQIPKPNLPMPSLPSFNKALAANKISLRRPNLRVSLQTMNPMNKIRLIKDAGNARQDQKPEVTVVGVGEEQMNKTDSKDIPVVIDDDATKDVVFQSCGILATSPKQLIKSSINLSCENKKRMSVDGNTLSPTPSRSAKVSEDNHMNDPTVEDSLNVTKTKEEEKEGETVVSDENAENLPQIEIESDAKEENETFVVNASGKRKILAEKFDAAVDTDDSDKNGECESEDDDAYCVIDNEEVRIILDKTKQLQHPHMKISLSDSSISIASGPGSAGNLNRAIMEGNESSLVSRLKLKMANLSRPGPSKNLLEPSVITKNHIRKSQRAMEVFENLMRDKLPGSDCKSRFIFI